MHCPDTKLKLAIEDYLRLDKNPETRGDIETLAKDGKFDQLRPLLLTRASFGTAGIRGKMGSGFSRLNELVIIQTSQGLAKYLVTLYGEEVTSGGIVIGYDARHNSRIFAVRAATAFLNANFKVYLFGEVVPTPFISFAVQHLSTVAGVVITASHNSKEYNGYKVYLKNGAQINSPHDERIQESIQRNFEPWENAWDNDLVSKSEDPYSNVVDAYFDNLKSIVGDCSYIRNTKLIITFTALHGVSHLFMKRAFRELNFPYFQPVAEQMYPDPEFPTVQYPNPEEGRSVFYCSFKTADENNSTLIVANDPDADRCAVAEKSGPNGSWRIFTGNEMGALLGWWSWFRHKQENDGKKVKPSDCYMVSTTVSSKILNSYARKEGFQFIETLTGFKWIGNKVDELIKSGKEVIFAFEEAIGFMVDPQKVKDKDGISASVVMAQMAAYLKQTYDKTLSDQLYQIYKEHGFHTSRNSYFKCHDKNTIETLFNKMSSPYPRFIGPYRVLRVRDLNKLYDSGTKDHKPLLSYSSPAYMITFYLENGIVIHIRTSGTEPKIKYYTEAIGEEGDEDWASISKLLDDVVWNMVNQLFEPEKYKLVSRQ